MLPTNTAEGYTMDTTKNIIKLIDVYGWSLSAAKAEFKKLTGKAIKARSKDEFINKLLMQ